MQTTEKTNAGASRRKEVVVLAVVAVLGLLGLAALQFARSGDGDVEEGDRALVQSGALAPAAAAPESQSKIQEIPGNLVTTSENRINIEANTPYVFRLNNFSTGAVYELEMADGTRKTFVDGKLTHTYPKAGLSSVSLYARYEGQEAKLQTITIDVNNKTTTEKKLEGAKGKPVIDY